MKKLSKLNLKDFREMSDSEMKNVVGGYYDDPFSGGGTGANGGGSGSAISCSDHTEPSACFGPMIELINDEPVAGKCEWKIIPELKYAGCVFVG
ncbi:TIGR04149 family rSAM-modified RiPP [Bacteroides sp. GM023]|uniref:TIGR04149 family rSAM-modified RiPP n=1 Tax=Bacteroides sp. GM023 TaxID=2723058 RepID=UPI00168BBEA0|nr:TIGR04149 family rSAM-modified RiPP [Bacteroides sp. GM023]MBD3588367.1 rSAM-modified peptide [Bacteroides sp. GM023]